MIPATTTNWQFLLTRLLRGATVTRSVRCTDPLCFYSHASCEARPSFYFVGKHRPVSTHTPLARRDDHRKRHPGREKKFLLTRLLRGATSVPFHMNLRFLRFYSHASCEARLKLECKPCHDAGFYSHASCEARHRDESAPAGRSVSTHTPLARRDGETAAGA